MKKIILLLIISIFINTNKDTIVFNDLTNIFKNEKYYLDKNNDKYIDYYSTHLETNIDDIIAIVNTHNTLRETDLSKDKLMLVNKYNYLPKNYIPSDLVSINTNYAYEGRSIKKEVYDNYKRMYNDALKNNIHLLIVSAYRDYKYQEKLYYNNLIMYGDAYASLVSSKPGFSEHQTGLTLDIISPSSTMNTFSNTKEYKWLVNNSYKYGFILRYPKNKEYLTGFNFESWHYRYVGKNIAAKIKKENITFEEYYAFYLDK